MSAQDPVSGEEDIIQTFLAPLAAHMPGALGLADDCALARPRTGFEFVLKTDPIAEGVHFLADDAPSDIAWKALAVNVSDLAAKGARPHGYLLALSFPAPPDRMWLAGFARGLSEAQAAFGIGLLGGDTDRRSGPLTISPTVLGEVPEGRMVRRGAARPGDIIAVSGTLGDAGLGLALRLDPGLAGVWGLSTEAGAQLVGRYLRPQPRLALGGALLEHAGAAMDVSDGLLKDLGRMCRVSGCGADLGVDRLPLSDAFRVVERSAPEVARRTLFAGDDYEVLAAIAPERWPAMAAAAAAVGVRLTAVGTFRETTGIEARDGAGAIIDPGATGWDHF